MSFIDIFKPLKKTQVKRWVELGTYKAVFSRFGENIYASDLVRACVRPLADLTSSVVAILLLRLSSLESIDVKDS